MWSTLSRKGDIIDDGEIDACNEKYQIHDLEMKKVGLK